MKIKADRFYQSPLGQETQQRIARQLRPYLNKQKDQRILGIGSTSVYLSSVTQEIWDLKDVLQKSFPSCAFDRIFLIHALEYVEDMSDFLRTIWEMLSEEGELILVVPNQFGFWARSDKTPYKTGRAFRCQELRHLLCDSLFNIQKVQSCLFMPPALLLKSAKLTMLYEKCGTYFFPFAGGVWTIGAKKRIYAMSGTPQQKYRLFRQEVSVT